MRYRLQVTSFRLQVPTPTCNLQPATCNLQPATNASLLKSANEHGVPAPFSCYYFRLIFSVVSVAQSVELWIVAPAAGGSNPLAHPILLLVLLAAQNDDFIVLRRHGSENEG